MFAFKLIFEGVRERAQRETAPACERLDCDRRVHIELTSKVIRRLSVVVARDPTGEAFWCLPLDVDLERHFVVYTRDRMDAESREGV